MRTAKTFTHSFSASELEQIVSDFLQYDVEDGKISFKWKLEGGRENFGSEVVDVPLEFSGLEVTVCKP